MCPAKKIRVFMCILVPLACVSAMTARSESPRQETQPGWTRQEISRNWMIRSIQPCASLDQEFLAAADRAASETGWLAAPNMPAMVHDILLAHGRIETPWMAGAAEKCLWVAEQDWIYAVRFAAEHPEAESRLHFAGLDTIVDVYLNGRFLASHWNMFVPLSVDVTGRLRAENSLVLHFHSVFEKTGGKVVPIRRVGGDPKKHVRRPNQNYGNYLGPQPRFSRVGVYDKVFLEITNGSRLDEVMAGASLDETLSTGTVQVDFRGESRLANIEIRCRLLDPDGLAVADAGVQESVREGIFEGRLEMRVGKPRLWWPRGYGDQPLYTAEITLLAEGQPHQTIRRTIGFRRVTMPQRLHFVVNGVPVRLWGGDWVTPHWQTAVWDQERVERLFAMAEHANFNAFRVWGEVESPRDDFYDLADKKGFLIWQDFTHLPLAPDAESRAICRDEAARMVKRLKHHPSIVVWNGGNEAAMWHHQEFNNALEDRGPWPGLAAAEEVGAICRALDPDRYYQPSSPFFGQDPNDPREGNTHGYTNMWFVPGYDYLNFASEDTRIAAPPLHSLKRFMAPQDLWPADYSPVFTHGTVYPYPKTWLRYTTGSSWKKTGPIEQFYDATDAASLVHRIGMAEALYYQDTIERQRRGRDAVDLSGRRRCGGYLVWKFNDSWPQIYSAKVDYFLEPYHAYYAIRNAFAPVLLSFEGGVYLHLWAVNDTRTTITGTARIQLFHLDQNQTRREIVKNILVPPGQSIVISRLDQDGIGTFRREHILYATLTDPFGQVLARARMLGDMERRVTFPNARLDVRVQDGILRVRSDRYAHCVTLEGDAEGDAFGWFFDDNYFDLMPGEEKSVRILGSHDRGKVTAKAWYSPHSTTVEWRRPTRDDQKGK